MKKKEKYFFFNLNLYICNLLYVFLVLFSWDFLLKFIFLCKKKKNKCEGKERFKQFLWVEKVGKLNIFRNVLIYYLKKVCVTKLSYFLKQIFELKKEKKNFFLLPWRWTTTEVSLPRSNKTMSSGE